MMLTGLLCMSLGASFIIEHVTVQAGDGTSRKDVAVLIDGGHIKAVGPVAPPNHDVKRIDGTGKVLTPGLIETRSHLGVSEVDAEETANDLELEHGIATPAFRVADGFNAASIRIPRAREEGITSAITVPMGKLLYGTGSWFDLTGKFASRPDAATPIAMYGGVGSVAAQAVGGARGGVWLQLREILSEARAQQRGHNQEEHSKTARLLKPWQLQALAPVVEGKLPLVLEADRASDILTIIDWAKSEKLKVVIAGGAEAWRVARELSAAKIPLIFQPSAQQPGSFDSLAARSDAATLLSAAGVQLILSAGNENMHVTRLRQEAGMAVAYGLGHDAALTAITLTPAVVFGKSGDTGSIGVGKRANVVLWSGDPFETLTVAEKVWIDGELQSLDTRQRRLAERYLAK